MPKVGDKNVLEAIAREGHDNNFVPTADSNFLPTDAPAGSQQKIEVMRMRVELGQPLWHRGDPWHGQFRPVECFAALVDDFPVGSISGENKGSGRTDLHATHNDRPVRVRERGEKGSEEPSLPQKATKPSEPPVKKGKKRPGLPDRRRRSAATLTGGSFEPQTNAPIEVSYGPRVVGSEPPTTPSRENEVRRDKGGSAPLPGVPPPATEYESTAGVVETSQEKPALRSEQEGPGVGMTSNGQKTQEENANERIIKVAGTGAEGLSNEKVDLVLPPLSSLDRHASSGDISNVVQGPYTQREMPGTEIQAVASQKMGSGPQVAYADQGEEQISGEILPISGSDADEPVAEGLVMESSGSLGGQGSSSAPLAGQPSPTTTEFRQINESACLPHIFRHWIPEGLATRGALEQPDSHESPPKPSLAPSRIVLPKELGVSTVAFIQHPGALVDRHDLLRIWRSKTGLSNAEVRALLAIFVSKGVFVEEDEKLRKTTADLQVGKGRRLAVTGSVIQRKLPQSQGNHNLTVDEIMEKLRLKPGLLATPWQMPEGLRLTDKDDALRLVGLVLCSRPVEESTKQYYSPEVQHATLQYTGYTPRKLKQVVLQRSYRMLLESLERAVERLALEEVCNSYKLNSADYCMKPSAKALLLRLATQPLSYQLQDVQQMQELWGLEKEAISKFLRTVLCKAKDEMFGLLAEDTLLTLMLNAKLPGTVEAVKDFAYGKVYKKCTDKDRQRVRVRKLAGVNSLFKAVIFARGEPKKESTPRLEVPARDRLQSGWSVAFKEEFLKAPQEMFAEAQQLSAEKAAQVGENEQQYLRRIFLVALAGSFGTRPEDKKSYPALLTKEFRDPVIALRGIVRQAVQAILRPVVERCRGQSFDPDDLSKELLELLPKELCKVWLPAKGWEVLELRLSCEGSFTTLGEKISLTESQFRRIWNDEWHSVSAINQASKLIQTARRNRKRP